MSETLLILGASVRAAVFSAQRAGFSATGGDLFADADLRAVCRTTRAETYPADLERIAAAAPPGAWMFTGALENHPQWVDRISRHRELLGNCGNTLRQVRDPRKFAQTIDEAGLATPECSNDERGVPSDGTWLRKPRRSAGGMRIEPWTVDTKSYDVKGGWYFQRFRKGTPCAAVYVADGHNARLVGVSEQWVGMSWTRSGPFQYSGSVGPLKLSPQLAGQFDRLGDALAGRFGLVGLFGVDAIIADDTPWAVEVNPRYTASVEVLERALGVRAMTLHVDACRDKRIDVHLPDNSDGVAAKAVLYAQHRVHVTDEWSRSLLEQNHGQTWPAAADIPTPGTIIPAGAPVVTLLDTAEDRTAVLDKLRRRASQCERSLYS